MRWVQDRETGLCRQCGRATGGYNLTTHQDEARRVEKRATKQRRLSTGGLIIPLEQRLPRPSRFVVIEQIEYEVMWDGT